MDETIKSHIEFSSQKRLEMLKRRTGRCVCKFCGGKLGLREIAFTSFTDARIEIFCKTCNRIEFGVEPQIYENARYFVEETGFNCFPDMDESDKTKQMSVARTCEIMTWCNQNLGILSPDGFEVPLKQNRHYVGECITLSDSDLAETDLQGAESDSQDASETQQD